MEYIKINYERTASTQDKRKAIRELISVRPPPGVFGSPIRRENRHHSFRYSLHPAMIYYTAAFEDYLATGVRF